MTFHRLDYDIHPHEKYFQTTLCNRIERAGVGIHSGTNSVVHLSPAPANSGIRFKVGSTEFAASHENVLHTDRATCIGVDGVYLSTVEHILSALNGLNVTNALIEVQGSELPILDGSAGPWVEAIMESGICQYEITSKLIRLAETVVLKRGDSYLVATPAEEFSLTCITHFDHPMLGTQVETVYDDAETYRTQIAPARTFGFQEEVEKLLSQGLALGGNFDNALIVYQDRFSSDLRVRNECLHHKILDLFGDLSLAGGRIIASITAIRPGHKINTEFAGLLAKNALPSISEFEMPLDREQEVTDTQGVLHAGY